MVLYGNATSCVTVFSVRLYGIVLYYTATYSHDYSSWKSNKSCCTLRCIMAYDITFRYNILRYIAYIHAMP